MEKSKERRIKERRREKEYVHKIRPVTRVDFEGPFFILDYFLQNKKPIATHSRKTRQFSLS
jgi:hypothetical protein